VNTEVFGGILLAAIRFLDVLCDLVRHLSRSHVLVGVVQRHAHAAKLALGGFLLEHHALKGNTEDAALQKLRDAGWSYKGKHRVWKKPIGEHPAADTYKNHKIFREIANSILERSGLGPVEAVGNGVS
jgi:hypothetical protein